MKFKHISITADGTWLHDGVEITHEKTISLFKRSVYFKKGKYFLSGEKNPVPVEVQDVAFFVTGIVRKQNNYWISLTDGSEERLDCTTLDQNESNALYCLIKSKSVPAKFERKAYHDLMKDLAKQDGYYGLVVDGLFYPIQIMPKPQPVVSKPNQSKSVQPARSGRKSVTSKKPKSKPTSKKQPTKKSTPKKPAPKKPAKKIKNKPKKSPAKKPAKSPKKRTSVKKSPVRSRSKRK